MATLRLSSVYQSSGSIAVAAVVIEELLELHHFFSEITTDKRIQGSGAYLSLICFRFRFRILVRILQSDEQSSVSAGNVV